VEHLLLRLRTQAAAVQAVFGKVVQVRLVVQVL
jgi:hypothetical protein